MTERKCCRCHEAIEPGEDFFSQDGEDSDDVYCIGCIDDAVEHVPCKEFVPKGENE